MDPVPFKPTYLTVPNEDCNLHAWHQGSGALLILIAGGGGNGSRFNGSIPALSTRFQVCTFDRRGNSASTVATPRALNPVQQARDVVAIIKALGHTQAIVFGTSGGGIIAFQVAASFPQHVSALIAHETPTLALVPDAERVLDHVYETIALEEDRGWRAAYVCHMSMMVGVPDQATREEDAAMPNGAFFFKHEFRTLSTYTPNLTRVRDLCRQGAMKVAVTMGRESGDAVYARTTLVQAEIIGCQHHVWAGEHLIYENDPDAFTEAMLTSIERLG